MNAEKLYEMLRQTQEPKGYYFNQDRERTFELLEALLQNKDRYGYMACPCEYREPDVAEYGSCFCNLYVSKEWNAGEIPHAFVPERRPPEKVKF